MLSFRGIPMLYLNRGSYWRPMMFLTFAVLVWHALTSARFDRSAPIVARAEEPPAKEADDPNAVEYRVYEWKRNAAPVKMISKDEGYCFLTEIGGHFAGGGESVKVYIGEDGFWYLGGGAFQDIWAKAMSVKFPHKMAAVVLPPPDPAVEAWAGALGTFAASADAGTKELAASELKALPSDPDGLMALADAWNALAPKRELAERRLVESHILNLYATAVGKLAGPALPPARKRFDSLRIALANRQLNDLAEWKVDSGQWSTKADGRIEGHDNSTLLFNNALPADCFIEFRVSVIDGQRPRIHFKGCELYVGNEGDLHDFQVFGAETQRGVPVPYVHEQEFKFGMKLSGKNFEFYVDGELMAKGTRKAVPLTLNLALSAGDDWSRGTAQFWDFKVSAVE
jgi:hypothetical protein